MLKQKIATVGVIVPFHIKYVPNNSFLRIKHTPLISDKTSHRTYEHLHILILPTDIF